MYKKLIFLLIFIPFFLQSQTQIGVDIDGKLAGDQLGWSTAISNDGSIIAVGASGVISNKGYVKVYKNENNNWIQQGNDIIGDNIGDFFGYTLSISNDGLILAIGAYGANNNSGLVKVYKFNNNSWSQLGSTILGEKYCT
ncbi:hypothetical protein [Polaribacter ponticola]|uniref:T9SS C-terminal target domain-containing protein n=1 Tax=Polaribacter ponticola TaxID=2978475 RepID=A0ABT5SBN7_9FLAO|nr:hypothetical protein [Polaribacter sp. MSW5]MDD7915534.1 hypothetical protein [Polaribacter sp. MSW5]